MRSFPPARYAALTLLPFMAVSCSDGPVTPGGGVDLAGVWSVSVTDATTFGRTCSISGMTMTFIRDGGGLSGSLDANGNGVVCTLNGGSTETDPLPESVPFERIAVSGNDVQLRVDGEGAQDNGGWVITGVASGADTISGEIVFRVAYGGVFSTTLGQWTAQR